jgi:G protein-coupled receptor GPR1
MIAVHNALYIFKPPTSIVEGGLYPYRYIAYVFWIVLPLLMASLAFINPTRAYISGGASCHLPVRPFWYRLALSWIPRYLIFIFILSTNASIYFFVMHKFGDFSKSIDTFEHPTITQDSAEGGQGEYRTGKGNRGYMLPQITALAYNGLIPETRRPSVVSQTMPNLSASRSWSRGSKAFGDSSTLRRSKLSFQRHVLKANTSSDTASSVLHTSDVVATLDPFTSETTAASSSPVAVLMLVPGIKPSAQKPWTSFAAQFNPSLPSNVSLTSFLRLPRNNTSFSSETSAPLHRLQLIDSQSQSLNIQKRKKILQQLRFLFVYPLAYMAMWILPFVSHALQYNDYYAANPPFLLNAFVTVIAISQSTVNCWIFNIKEKPWRHSVKKTPCKPRRGGGESNSAMEAEARFAYQRRDEEAAARTSEIHSTGRSERRERSWWDEMEDMEDTPPDGMSPLADSEMVNQDGQLAPADDAGCQPQKDTEINKEPRACTII